jgi:2-keto-4-pentenoate hydratase/2-oxohepta-3-ene-1,7-dioic acid hydratase in catechol pathway
MKIIRFATKDQPTPQFGVVINAHAVAFTTLADISSTPLGPLSDSNAYLENLPESETIAKELLAWGEKHFGDLHKEERLPLTDVFLKTPIEVYSLFDFGLTPRHLKNSMNTLLKHEKGNPKILSLLQMIAHESLSTPEETAEPNRDLGYYKCNMNAVVGDDVMVPWPIYTEYLDIEPELAVVYGNEQQPVAGYCIFNDVSARDVQAPEFVLGFRRSKDLGSGNQLGPYLVTSDEVGDAYQQSVLVTVNGAQRFKGTTTEISHRAEDVFTAIESIAPLRPGSVMGFGTIPDCTGLDLDEFLDPGDEVAITFERLGTLSCRLAEPVAKVISSRWEAREALNCYR